MQSWNIPSDGAVREVVYNGLSPTGKAKLLIDGAEAAVLPIFLKGQGFFFRYPLGETELILRMERKNDPAQLAVDGIYYGSDRPVESDVLFTLRSRANAGHPLERKSRDGMGVFLAFVLFTYVNIAMFVFDVPFVFPFSARFPCWLLEEFYIISRINIDSVIYIIGIVLALLCTTVYLVIYAFARKHTPPLVAALVLMLVDTALVLLELTGNFSYMLLDAIFHVLILAALLSTLRARRGLRRQKVRMGEVE